ncbi:MAG: hypothetical protein HUU20_04975 [Pirellulales bacterium]|nr:hypothetical protein [Pirellulales bacterium]
MPRKFRPQFEKLETRWCPALLLGFDDVGDLVSIAEDSAGQEAEVSLQVDADGRLHVQEGATDYGVHDVGVALSVSLGQIVPGFSNRLELNDQTLNTDLSVSLGDQGASPGATTFFVLGGTLGSEGEGTINGGLNVQGGSGGQGFVFGETDPVPHVVNVTGFVHADMGLGGSGESSDFIGTGSPAAKLRTLDDMEVFRSAGVALSGSIGGDLFIRAGTKAVSQEIYLGNFGRPLGIGGNVFILTGNLADVIELENATIVGNLSIRTGNGADQVRLGNIDPANDPGDLDPRFTNAPSAVFGKVFADLGEGEDLLEAGDVVSSETARFTIGQTLEVYGGTGNDTVNFNNLRVIGDTISVYTNEGNDRFFMYRVQAARARVLALLGDGDDTFEVDAAAQLRMVALTVNGRGGADTKIEGNLADFTFPVNLFNFEL